MACLDTAFLLDLQGRGGRAVQARARQKLEELSAANESLTTTRFNVAELWVGVERSEDPQKEAESVGSLLAPLEVLDFDHAAAEVFGRSMAFLMKAGRVTGDMDLLIASVALVNGQTVITRNAKHFSGIPGLTVESY
jgi:tRNA(fMet)-specific endonuclease VapC